MTARSSPTIRDEIWNKLLGNLGNAAAGGADAGEHPRSVPGAGLRGGGAARDAGGAPRSRTPLGANPTPITRSASRTAAAWITSRASCRTWNLGRPMEIDGIFDAPLELARMVGVATPTLDLLVAMAKVRARAAGLYPR